MCDLFALSWLNTKNWTVYNLSNHEPVCNNDRSKPVVDANWRLVFAFCCVLVEEKMMHLSTIHLRISNSEIRKLKCDSDEMICESIGMFSFSLGLSTQFSVWERNFIHEKCLVHLYNRSHFTCRVLHVEMSPE